MRPLLDIVLGLTLVVFSTLILVATVYERKGLVCLGTGIYVLFAALLCFAHARVSLPATLVILLAWFVFALQYFDAPILSLSTQSTMLAASVILVFVYE